MLVAYRQKKFRLSVLEMRTGFSLSVIVALSELHVRYTKTYDLNLYFPVYTSQYTYITEASVIVFLTRR